MNLYFRELRTTTRSKDISIHRNSSFFSLLHVNNSEIVNFLIYCTFFHVLQRLSSRNFFRGCITPKTIETTNEMKALKMKSW